MTTLVFETTIFCEKILLRVVLVWQNNFKKQKPTKIKTVFLAL